MVFGWWWCLGGVHGVVVVGGGIVVVTISLVTVGIVSKHSDCYSRCNHGVRVKVRVGIRLRG